MASVAQGPNFNTAGTWSSLSYISSFSRSLVGYVTAWERLLQRSPVEPPKYSHSHITAGEEQAQRGADNSSAGNESRSRSPALISGLFVAVPMPGLVSPLSARPSLACSPWTIYSGHTRLRRNETSVQSQVNSTERHIAGGGRHIGWEFC